MPTPYTPDDTYPTFPINLVDDGEVISFVSYMTGLFKKAFNAVNWLKNHKVNIAGDTMTGDLLVTGHDVSAKNFFTDGSGAGASVASGDDEIRAEGAGNISTVSGDITTASGDIEATTGDIRAPAGTVTSIAVTTEEITTEGLAVTETANLY